MPRTAYANYISAKLVEEKICCHDNTASLPPAEMADDGSHEWRGGWTCVLLVTGTY